MEHSKKRAEVNSLPAARRLSAVVLTAATFAIAGPCYAAEANAADVSSGAPRLTTFLSADGALIRGSAVEPRLEETARLTADFLATWERGGFRALAELVAATDEVELERLQLGWELTANTIVWLGRFHQPASYWGYQYHHGQFAQTSISRPQIDDWEDEEGLLPQHLEGLLVDTSLTTRRGQRFDLSFGAGVAPRLVDRRLDPIDVFQRQGSSRMPAYALRATWYPDAMRDASVSALLMHSEIENATSFAALPRVADHLDQNVVGLFADYPAGNWRLTAGGYYISVRAPRGSGVASRSFASGYLQAEFELVPALRAFGRLESTGGARSSPYLREIGAVIDSRSMLGVRWEYSRRQALTLEIARADTNSGAATEYRAQWSAVLD